jgi:L-lysine 2,3-aminomutase
MILSSSMETNQAARAIAPRTFRDTPPKWQAAVRDAVRDPAELASLLELAPDALGPPAAGSFPLLVPRGFVARMRKRDPRDPLLRQVWPAALEGSTVPGFGADPLGEQRLAAHGVLKKYAGRALLIASGACPVHCRYCFRREFPYRDQLAARADWTEALAALERLGDVTEVILSGGDPLSLTNARLAALLARLDAKGIQTVRIHSRFPIAVPERVDDELLNTLGAFRPRCVVVVHCNHANELDAATGEALARLRPRVAALLNQSVLLAGVNDDADTLIRLSERLFACGVLPYYLHLLDRVAGAAHFDVDAATGRALIAALRARLPGYLVPRLVQEIPASLSKTPIA